MSDTVVTTREQVLLEILRADGYGVYGLVVVGRGACAENFCDNFPRLYHKKDAQIKIDNEKITFQNMGENHSFKIHKDEVKALRRLLCLCHYMKVINIEGGHGFRMEAPHP
ncbi:MAG: hypothetical protein PHX25_03755 [Candidatus Pacebacteria bacterium]|nr:hypothetical protein [Candidatus Paceibacterota bacterium]